MSDPGSPAGRDRCGAKSRGTPGGTCGLPAGWGTDHVGVGRCRLHGGSTRTHQAAARAEVSQRVARTAVEAWGLEVETTPQAAVLGQLGRFAMRVKAIEHLVSTTARGDGRVVDAAELGVTDEWGPPALAVRESLPRQWGTEIRVVRNPMLDVLRDAEADLRAAAKVCHDMGVAEALIDAVRLEADALVGFLSRAVTAKGLVFDESWIEAGVTALPEARG